MMNGHDKGLAVPEEPKGRAARRRFWTLVVRLVERFHHTRALTIVPGSQSGVAGLRVALVPHPDVPDRDSWSDAWVSFDDQTGGVCSSEYGVGESISAAENLDEIEIVTGFAIEAWPIDESFLAEWQRAAAARAVYLHAVRQLAALASGSDAPVVAIPIQSYPVAAGELKPLRETPPARSGWLVGGVTITDTAVARVEGAGEIDIVGRWLEGDDEAAITRRIRKLAEQAGMLGLRGDIEPLARFPESARDIVPDPTEEGVFWLFNFNENGWFRWRTEEAGDGTPVPSLKGLCGACAQLEGAWWLITSGGTMLRLPWDGRQEPLPCMRFRSEKRLVIDPDGGFVVDDECVRLPMPTTVEQWARDSAVALPLGQWPGHDDWPLVCGGGRWFAVVDPSATAPVRHRRDEAPVHFELPSCGHPEHAAGHPTRPWFAFASRVVVVVDAALRRVVVAFDGRTEFRSVVFSPDGRWLLFATADGLGLWKVGTGAARFVGRFRPGSNHQRAARSTLSGKRVLFGGGVFEWAGLIDRWDTGTALMPLALPPAVTLTAQ